VHIYQLTVRHAITITRTKQTSHLYVMFHAAKT